MACPVRSLLVVGAFQYHRRVLDAWILCHLDKARQNFESKETVAQRRVYVPSPIEIDGVPYPTATLDGIRPLTSSSRWCVLIHGEGGIGKTALACEIARWAMSSQISSRLCPSHPMLPILLESGVVPDKLDQADAFIHIVSGQLRALIGAMDDLDMNFVRQLLKQTRLLVIADDIEVNPSTTDFSAAALIVTSRQKRILGDVPRTVIVPQRIHAEHLSTFLHAYLTAKGERATFSDTNFFGACQRLSAIVRDRSITALLAKMYAELLIGSKGGGITTALPKDIPELMLRYLSELNRRKNDAYISDDDVRRYTQLIARNAITREYRLVPVERARLISIIGGEIGLSVLDYLEHRLHLIRSVGTAKDYISFTVEPLAEYMAAMTVVHELSNDNDKWKLLIMELSNAPNISFTLALWDCVLSLGRSADCPEWVAAELANLVPKETAVMMPDLLKIGVLHSLSGTMAISERSLVDAVQLAVDEINSQGGLLNRRLIAVIEDGASDPSTFARKAERLIIEEKVCALFGCWTSASRKAVLPVVEEHDHLLFYPLQYEGFESSRNIIYTGASPNQQIIPAVEWCLHELERKRSFLVGSDYVFPRIANKIIRTILPQLGGSCVGETYRPLGDRSFDEVVNQILSSGADVIFNTINGDSNIAFFNALRNVAVTPDTIPVISFSIAEDELRSIGTEFTAGHYCAWNYFQCIDTEENHRFVTAFKNKYGSQRVTDDPIEAAYVGIHIFALAVTKARSTDPRAIREACRGLEYKAPCGLVKIDPDNQHTWTVARVGRILNNGQFDLVWSSPEIIKPNPFSVII